MSLLDYIDQERLPNHIAIIMDGNGRWATNKGFERGEGHKEGVRAISRVVEAATKASIKYLTLYAFSTENWNRPAEEVNGLMDLMVYAISEETEKLKKNGVRITCIGDMDRLPEYARTALIECIDQTKEGNTLTLNIALSYSSKWELTEAARRIADDVLNGVLNKEDISEETISMYLTTHGIPDPDLLIRTGGEPRISNFLL
ncbi:MAG: di-trans,poly-cis-decaprenylcistransferase, partial [Fermentimonas sp.]|nr:di-trans,poly-cis-decaprenylcistransferase [Fermentimonas sp.]